MLKPSSLKQHLINSVPALRKHTDRVLVFMDDGHAISTTAVGLSFEYSYNLKLIITDYAGDPDAIFVPLIAWVGINQRELLENHERNKTAIAFDAEVLANDLVDIEISLPLTERVIVKRQEDGSLSITHPPEPELEPFLPAGHYQLITNGDVLAEWDSIEGHGVDMATPHPQRPNHGQ